MRTGDVVIAAAPQPSPITRTETAVAPLQLQAGEIVSATVVPNPDQSSPVRTALEIKGVVVPAALPPEVLPGDEISLKVLHPGSPIVFRFLGDASTTDPGSQRPPAIDHIASVLRALDVSPEEIRALRSAVFGSITELSEPIVGSQSGQPPVTPVLITDADLNDAAALSKIIQRLSLTDEVVDQVAQITKNAAAMEAARSAPSTETQRVLDALRTNLEQALDTAAPALALRRQTGQLVNTAKQLSLTLRQDPIPDAAEAARRVDSVQAQLSRIDLHAPDPADLDALGRAIAIVRGATETASQSPRSPQENPYLRLSPSQREALLNFANDADQLREKLEQLAGSPTRTQNANLAQLLDAAGVEADTPATEISTRFATYVRQQAAEYKDLDRLLSRFQTLQGDSSPVGELERTLQESQRLVLRSNAPEVEQLSTFSAKLADELSRATGRDLPRIATEALGWLKATFPEDSVDEQDSPLPHEVRRSLRIITARLELIRTTPPEELENQLALAQLEKNGFLPALRNPTGPAEGGNLRLPELQRFVRAQTDYLARVEVELTKFLDGLNDSDPVATLRATLDRAAIAGRTEAPGLSGESLRLQLQFESFITELQTKLSSTSPALSPELLRTVLADALEELHGRFSSLTLPETLTFKQLPAFEPKVELPKQPAALLRSIETQLRLILDAPMGTSITPALNILDAQLGELSSAARDVPAQLRGSIERSIESIRTALEPARGSGMLPESSRDSLRSELHRLHQQFAAASPSGGSPQSGIAEAVQNLSQSFANMIAQASGTPPPQPNAFDVALHPAARTPTPIAQIVQNVTARISQAVRELPPELAAGTLAPTTGDLVEALRQSATPTDRGAPPAPSLDTVQRFIRAVADLGGAQRTTPANTAATEKFIDTLREIGREIERMLEPLQGAPRNSATALLRDLSTALKATDQTLALLVTLGRFEEIQSGRSLSSERLTQLTSELQNDIAEMPGEKERTLLRSAQTALRSHLATRADADEKPQSGLEAALRSLRGAETILRGQEALAKLAPLMQAAGEPALMLFPALFGGFLSQIELTLYPEPKTNPDKQQRGPSGPDAHGFFRAHLACTLPGLGGAEVSIAHKKKEIRLELRFENKEAARFVERKVSALKKLLTERGYETIESKVFDRLAKPKKPGWVRAVARSSKAVA